MITTRARQWLRRATAITLFAAVAVVVAATWVYAAQIEHRLLRVDFSMPAYDVEVLAVAGGEVTLARGSSAERPGVWGLEWETGYARIGPVSATSQDGVGRPLLEVAGQLRPGLRVRLDAFAYESDPSDAGLAFENVIFEGPLGNYPAWRTLGDDDTWVIVIHGANSYRRQALRMLPTVAALGFPTLTITYRNDRGAPPGPGGRYELGSTEWVDLQAAVEYALAEGAQDLVLVGFGMGGSIAATFLHESEWAERVQGVILDAPLLDAGVVVDEHAAAHNVPGLIVGWAKGLAFLRFGVDWGGLDQTERADEFDVPILLFHGDTDEEMPIRSSDEFAAALSGLVRYERVAGAGHGASWNLNPERYSRALSEFLAPVAAGPTDLSPVVFSP